MIKPALLRGVGNGRQFATSRRGESSRLAPDIRVHGGTLAWGGTSFLDSWHWLRPSSCPFDKIYKQVTIGDKGDIHAHLVSALRLEQALEDVGMQS